MLTETFVIIKVDMNALAVDAKLYKYKYDHDKHCN